MRLRGRSRLYLRTLLDEPLMLFVHLPPRSATRARHCASKASLEPCPLSA